MAGNPGYTNDFPTENVGVDERLKGTSKPHMLLTVIFSVIANFVVLVSVLVNLPLFRDTLDFGRFEYVYSFLKDYYVYGDIAAVNVLIAATITMYSNYVKHGFPSKLSLAAMVYNSIATTVFSVIMYVVDLRNIYFSHQILLVIPIITIFLSSVFIIDDFDELRRNKFIIGDKKPRNNAKPKKRKKGELLPAEPPSQVPAEIVSIPSAEARENAAAEAAKIAIPTLGETAEWAHEQKITEATEAEAAEDVADETAQDAPSESAEEIPSEPAEEIPSEPAEEIPSEPAEEIPSETAEEIPSETAYDASADTLPKEEITV